MEIKTLLFFFIGFLASSASAQNASCMYANSSSGYTCYLSMNNPGGLEVTEITGDHLEGFSNDDVLRVYTMEGMSTIVPQAICSQYPNIVQIDFAFFGVTTLTENSFSGCPNMNFLRLWANRITELPEGVFANNGALRYLDLDSNSITAIPENVFSGLSEIRILELRNNPLETVPSGLFNSLTNLQTLYLNNVSISEYNPAWFANNANLEVLLIYNNLITSFSEDSFNGLTNLVGLDIGGNPLTSPLPVNIFHPLPNLVFLYIDNNQISEINPAWFDTLENLAILAMYFNNFNSVPENAFNNLRNLLVLDIGYNPVTEIPPFTFRSLVSLNTLYLNRLRLRAVNPDWFYSTNMIQYLFLSFNSIDELPIGVFAPFRQLYYIGLWANNLKTLSRTHFGDIRSLYYIDLDENNINALDRELIEGAESLFVLYFWNNVCASGTFLDFTSNRNQNLERLQRCFRNYEFSVDTSTTGIEDYRIFGFPSPGVVFRVMAPERVHISLNPVNFEAVPRMEIWLGESNNTRSIIRRNGDENVVDISTPNILNANSWTGFRIVFVNWAILVYREGDQFPFMGFNMRDFYPIRFYGIRTPGNVVPWVIQPLDFEPDQPGPPVPAA